MLFHALPYRQRPAFGNRIGFIELGDGWRRWWWRHAEQDSHHPFTAQHWRGSLGDRSQGQNGSFAEQAPAVIVRELNAPELVTSHVRNSIVSGHAFVYKRVVRGEQVNDVAVLPHDAVEKQFGLTPHPDGERVVIERIKERVGTEVFQIRQMQPLTGELR